VAIHYANIRQYNITIRAIMARIDTIFSVNTAHIDITPIYYLCSIGEYCNCIDIVLSRIDITPMQCYIV